MIIAMETSEAKTYKEVAHSRTLKPVVALSSKLQGELKGG